jgi:hypothetical protein
VGKLIERHGSALNGRQQRAGRTRTRRFFRPLLERQTGAEGMARRVRAHQESGDARRLRHERRQREAGAKADVAIALLSPSTRPRE